MNPIEPNTPFRPLETASTGELVGRLAQQSKQLVLAEVALAKAELRADVQREVHMVEGLAAAALCALLTLNLLLMALVLGLADRALPGWAAALVVAAGVLIVGAVAGVVGWMVRVREPLGKTQKTLKEDVQWARSARHEAEH